jgi:hypothetical protein
MWNENPHCHWCGCKTQIFESPNKSCPPNGATIDHLISRLNPLRYKLEYYPQELFVLSCYSCNQNRGRKEEAELRKVGFWNSKDQLVNLLQTLG